MPILASTILPFHHHGDSVSTSVLRGLDTTYAYHFVHLFSRAAATQSQDSTHVSSAANASPPASTMGLGGTDFDSNALLASWQKRTVQVVSLSLASLSLLCCLVSLYWFILMRRNFRRTLIMLLLFADLSRSLWLLLFPVVSLTVGGVHTGSPFCDLSGFFLQASLESCDIAILLMSLHMSLQVFNPNSSRIGPDGLYRFRRAVYVLWVIVPAFMASLAFVRTGRGSYMSQGAFCSLAIRPFWYRLALSWIPRYLIWTYITYTAIHIYLHVGMGFTVFAREVESGSGSSELSPPPSYDQEAKTLGGPSLRRASAFVFEHMHNPFGNKSSSPTLATEGSEADDKSYAMSPVKTTRDHSHDTISSEAGQGLRITFRDPRDRQGSGVLQRPSNALDHGAAVIRKDGGTSNDPLVEIMSTADLAAAARRRAIQRQTRLLFIYPCVYMILMIMPFVQHCFNYSDYYAQRPIFAVSVLAPACYAFMGTADCIVFCWREKPWTLLAGSDGTFIGSFMFWRFLGPWGNASPVIGSAAFEKAANAYRTGRNRHGSVVDPSIFHPAAGGRRGKGADHNAGARFQSSTRQMIKHIRGAGGGPGRTRVFSGHSDQAALAAERAAERLALERAAHTQRINDATSQPGSNTPSKREWFDRAEELIEGEEDEEEEEIDEVAQWQRRMQSGNKTASSRKCRLDSTIHVEHEQRMRDFGAI